MRGDRAARAARAARAVGRERARRGAAGRREAVYGDDAGGRGGGVIVGCAMERFELFCDERMGGIWVTELYLIFKQEESPGRARTLRL